MPEYNQKKSVGGKRPGAGRKKGSANVKTRAIADKAIEEGITPLEVMLAAMRASYQSALQAEEGDGRNAMLTKAAGIASDAAPYIHPRLAAVAHSGDVKLRRASELSDDELAYIIATHKR
jgi:hypothetical protein